MTPSPAGRPRRRSLTICALAASAVILATTTAACGSGEQSQDRFEKSRIVHPTTPGSAEATEASGEPSASSVVPSTTAAVPDSAPEAVLAAIDAYRAALAGPVQALQYTQHFPGTGTSYASLQSQDPAKPANVDQREWRDGRVGEPVPVKLSGDGTLAENLFPLDEVNWPAVAAAIPSAQAAVEQSKGTPLEGSTGVTHIIVEKNLPFSADTVVRVYVDGGPRADGGYVQYRADGTLDKVQA